MYQVLTFYVKVWFTQLSLIITLLGCLGLIILCYTVLYFPNSFLYLN
jgi:hypothetical protein